MPKKKEQTEKMHEETVKAEFTKEQLLASEKFKDRRDFISALLTDDGKYSMAAVEEKIDNFMKGQVRK